jgi:hypothetical protein
VLGGDRAATAYVGVRVQLTPGSRGRAEVVLGEAVVRVRQQIGTRVDVLATRPLPSSDERQLAVAVRGDQITVQVDRLPPIVATLDRALARGAVDFGIAAQGGRTLTFVAPRLTDLQGAAGANQAPDNPPSSR